MTLEMWLLFTGAALVVILIPGPLSLLMISNSLNYGVRRSWPAFLGGVTASIALLSASALGLGALLMASERLFSALKLVGALYLFYLAWQSWQEARQAPAAREIESPALAPRFSRLFGRAFILTWAVLNLLCKLAYGLGAQGAARYLRTGKGHVWFNRTSAALFGGAGAASLMSR